MSELKRKIHIDAEPSKVYAVVADPDCLGEWVTIHDRLESAPDGDLAVGDELVQRLRVAGRCFRVAWTVREAQPPSLVVWEGRGPLGTKARAVYELSANDGGTSFSYLNDYSLPGGPAGRLAGRAIGGISGREADRSLERLKALVERRKS